MFIFDYLEHLRKKPVHYRKMVAFVWSVVITLAILLFWLSAQTTQIPSASKTVVSLEEELEPLNEIKKSSVNLFITAKSLWKLMFDGSTTTDLIQ